MGGGSSKERVDDLEKKLKLLEEEIRRGRQQANEGRQQQQQKRRQTTPKARSTDRSEADDADAHAERETVTKAEKKEFAGDRQGLTSPDEVSAEARPVTKAELEELVQRETRQQVRQVVANREAEKPQAEEIRKMIQEETKQQLQQVSIACNDSRNNNKNFYAVEVSC